MNKNINNKKKLVKGSGVLVVILSAITFSIYVSSTFSEEEHFAIMQKRYEKNLIQNYENDINDIEEIYEKIYNEYYR